MRLKVRRTSEGLASNDVLVAGLGGEQDDGLLRVRGAHAVADLEAVDPGQHAIQQGRVEAAAQGLGSPSRPSASQWQTNSV